MQVGNESGSLYHFRCIDCSSCEIITGEGTTITKCEWGKARPVSTLAKARVGTLGVNSFCSCFQVVPCPISGRFVDPCICKCLRQVDQPERTPILGQGVGLAVQCEDVQQSGDEVFAADSSLRHIVIQGQQLAGGAKGCHQLIIYVEHVRSSATSHGRLQFRLEVCRDRLVVHGHTRV